MAKARVDLNKSEEIRKIFAQNPAATAKEVVAKLKEQGIVASEGLVYSLKPGSKKKKKGPKGKAKAAPSSNGALSVGASIAVAKAAAEKVGGWAALKEMVDALQ
jgi:transketolase N-terminal domain/subunit